MISLLEILRLADRFLKNQPVVILIIGYNGLWLMIRGNPHGRSY